MPRLVTKAMIENVRIRTSANVSDSFFVSSVFNKFMLNGQQSYF